MLICYARCHKVQELCIDTWRTDTYDWKWILSKWESLTVLRISAYDFMDDWEAWILPSLRILEIHGYITEAQEYEEITISGFPNLESLVLVNYYCDDYIICAPKLKNLEVRFYFEAELSFPQIDLDTPNLKCVTFKDVLPTLICDSEFSYLEKVNLTIDDFCSTPQCRDSKEEVIIFLSCFECFIIQRSLTMPLKAIEVLLLVPSLSERLSFHNLRHLKLKRERTKKNMLDLPTVSLAYFLKCATLETLVVDLNQD